MSSTSGSSPARSATFKFRRPDGGSDRVEITENMLAKDNALKGMIERLRSKTSIAEYGESHEKGPDHEKEHDKTGDHSRDFSKT